mmetsp:Transcript_29061/g.61662  ORF Transcript_29061/g.61662 Transcript_29061/m.61662 type:complete len:466 (+) Transcript_29061:862-2259(+)|eukprot:CAMPEP_0172543522 /NCGR_PEP_ID=MMETSP1067-20121228/13884_1 /TAXON_ID=265564 ORGANISM="Thalassiosira punctigera, Strain Tpunct2005C2" /NCGR_SAMPLE_ID=MMETSP1067 /ASSEMBLY_ACC=CAM_ASM_000444 /LENGTH=465 /DNA_ID=CAMNT_0013329953 /DNA_START=778 /DNA_END=2175 /DNA_ORIENTATION=+
MNEDDSPADRKSALFESTMGNPAGTSVRRQNLGKMISAHSDDGDYDLDERMIAENPTLMSNAADIGGSYSYGGGGGQYDGGGGDDDMQVDDGEPILCQPIRGDDGRGRANNVGKGTGLPTFQEADMEEDDDDDDDLQHPSQSRDDGSDISSAEKYADRNSDPGVHVTAEADYALPIMPPGSSRPRRGSRPEDTLPADMAMTNVMDPNHLERAGGAASGLPHPNPVPGHHHMIGGGGGGGESVNNETATQTHEVRMPMLLSTFKPATGCTNASDFVVRCFVARLRSGITVVKHGRSRWCKSRLRVLHVHPDGRSLSWKPALGEPSSGKRPPKLDLTSCREVRHAWSPDPDNPMFTGTPILRQKCEAANAHKSFALVFPKRTVDITAVTADQCKVLMEGFSALCFRLQVAQNVANSAGGASGAKGAGKEGEADTESVTLTNASSTLRGGGGGPGSPKKKGGKKRSFR